MPSCRRCDREVPADGRFCSYCGVALSTPELVLVRRTATMVFVDLVGSTRLGEQLDPESLTTVLRRYFDVARAVVESHGGTIMKYMGDAVVAVFGLPVSREDDPLRAARAAWQILQKVRELNVDLLAEYHVELVLRAGVNTGEVAADTSALEESFVFGDTANTAARLEQHAPPGTMLLGERTFQSARHGLSAQEQAPIEVKGKTEPVRAYRVVAVEDVHTTERRLSRSTMIGRTTELDRLHAALDRASRFGVQTVTVVGEAGLGKSRLLSEFAASIPAGATSLVGRCLPYGEGVVYWSVREILQALAADDDLIAMLYRLLDRSGSRDPYGEAYRIARAVSVIDDGAAAASPDELAWGLVHVLREAASGGVVVVAFDDVHWAGTAVVRLIERLSELLSDAPVLIACAARREFLADHPDWATRTNGELIELSPLDDALSAALIQDLVPSSRFEAALIERVHRKTGGNPLFVEQTVRMLIDEHLVDLVGSTMVAKDGALDSVPTSLQSLIGARIEQLPPDESRLLTRAAVFGAQFDLESLALVAGHGAVEATAILARLIRHGLIDPSIADGTTYTFRHSLTRDAAYERLGKQDRADLHLLMADRLERLGAASGVDNDEPIGFHLERAYQSRVDLRPPTPADVELADAAAQRLSTAGRRAAQRGDVDSSGELLRRAVALLQPSPLRPRLQAESGVALLEAGRFDDALAVLGEAANDPAVDGDTTLLIEVVRDRTMLHSANSGEFTRAAHERGFEALRRFASIDDESSLLQAGWLVVLTSMALGRMTAGRSAIDQLMATAVSGPNSGRLPGMLAMNLAWGPTPAKEALEQTTRLVHLASGDPAAEPLVLAHHAHLLGICGRFVEARVALTRMRDLLERQGQRLLMWGAWSQGVGRIELDAGEPQRAEAAIRDGYNALVGLGERGFASALAGQLAQVLVQQQRLDEAAEFAEACARDAGEADVLSQIFWRTARAAIEEGLRPEVSFALLDEAIECAASTEWPTIQGQVFLRAATIHLRHDAHTGRADEMLVRARATFESKGHVVGLRQVDALRLRR